MPRYTFDNMAEAKAAETLWPLVKESRYILLTGELGSGKTTLVRNIARMLGVSDIVASPTFSIHNTYTSGVLTILHSDLYRLKSTVELEQTGFFELIESAGYVFIEWADLFNIKDMLERYAEIRIIKTSETARRYEVETK